MSDADISEAFLDSRIALQNESQVATVTFASERYKSIVYEKALKRRQKTRKGPNPDDKFDGLTVLYGGDGVRAVDLE